MKIVMTFLVYVWLISAACTHAFTSIHELAQIEPFITPDTLVIFDLDNTLVEFSQELGSDQWFTHMCKYHHLDDVLTIYYALQHRYNLQLIEHSTPHFIEHLKHQGIHVIALTARSRELATRTHAQLINLGLPFCVNPPHKESFSCHHKELGIYYDGIIFCASNSKGAMLCAFLEETKLNPSRIIMVDDKEKYLHDLAATLAPTGIEFIGFHYTRLAEKVAAFDAHQAEHDLVVFLHNHNLCMPPYKTVSAI